MHQELRVQSRFRSAFAPLAASALIACAPDGPTNGAVDNAGGSGGVAGSAGTGGAPVTSTGGNDGSAARASGGGGGFSGTGAVAGAGGTMNGGGTVGTSGAAGKGAAASAGQAGSSGGSAGQTGSSAGSAGQPGSSGGNAGQAGSSAGSAGRASGGVGGLSGGSSGSNSGSGGSTGGGGGGPGSVGCGTTGSPASGTYRIDVNGLEREFNLKLPANYDAKVPYRLIFAWHWLTGTAARVQSAGYYGLESRSAGTTIFAAGQGLDSNGDGEYGWPDTNGRDVAFARALLDWIRSRYCVDGARIFSTGWSYGGMFSNRLGCQMGDIFRAIAPMSGSGPSRTGCVGRVAAWISHGDADPTVSLSSGQGSRDHWLSVNHCTMDTMPTEPSPCVAYQGCDAGFPVQWCVFPGGHSQPSFGSAAIWNFFSQF